MINSLEKTLGQFQVGEELLADAVDALVRGWHASSVVVGKLRTEAGRWQTAIRQVQAPVNLASILRARTLV
ncbi:MAG: hypothetical protein M3N50_10100 [Pseudomonadota bacterium]|nr:hypothetical protein [Pseudomonadota bacterium]